MPDEPTELQPQEEPEVKLQRKAAELLLGILAVVEQIEENPRTTEPIIKPTPYGEIRFDPESFSITITNGYAGAVLSNLRYAILDGWGGLGEFSINSAEVIRNSEDEKDTVLFIVLERNESD